MQKLVAVLGELGRLQQVGVAAAVLVAVVVGAFGVGVIGTPAVEKVENRFTGVSENTTTVGTAITVSNPNPIGVTLGGTSTRRETPPLLTVRRSPRAPISRRRAASASLWAPMADTRASTLAVQRRRRR